MKEKARRSAFAFLIALTLLLGSFLPFPGLLTKISFAKDLGPSRAYVPIMMSTYPWRSPIGVEANDRITPDTALYSRTVQLSANWMRLNERVSWRLAQPNEGGSINWSQFVILESELIGLRAAGVTPMLIVDDYPSWATIDPTNSCSAIRADKREAFADFMAQLVNRYSKPPYSVKYWELGNEPDVDPSLVPNGHSFGCWGNIQDPYYGGESYGEMLKVVTPRIRTIDPSAKVLIGGLLLDREVTTNPNNGRPELFLKGILEADAGPYFDGVPYHFYPAYSGDPNLDHTLIGFATDGGILGKARYIRSLFSAYGISKPIYLNETALMCVNDTENSPAYCGDNAGVPPDAGFYTASSRFAVKGAMRAMSVDIKAFIWYVVDNGGWRNVGLFNTSGNPRPVYNVLRTLSQMIQNTTYLSTGSGYPTTHEAFVLRRSSKEQVHVVWSKTTATAIVSAPTAKVIGAYDMYGNALTPVQSNGNSSWSVGIDPIYIVRAP